MRSPFKNNDKKMVKIDHSKKIKVLFVLKDRNISYGISYGLSNSCNFVSNYLNSFQDKNLTIESKVVCVQDNNKIDREVHLFKPNIVVIEAYWVVPTKIEELIKLHKNVFWTIRSHSKVAFFQNEGIFVEWTRKYWELARKYKNISLSANSEEFIHELKKTFNIDIDYLPNIYMPKDYKCHGEKERYDDVLDVGCFCSVRPLKNVVMQAMAAIALANYLGKKLRFYINAGRVEQKGEPVLKNIIALFADSKHELVCLDWLNHDEFIKLIKKMDLVMQVSFSETFNIVGADAAWNDIPLVGSYEIGWMSQFFKASPTDFDDIFNKSLRAYRGKYLNFQKFNKWGLEKHNSMAKCEWIDWVKKH